jgi:hypothetical protein
MLVGCELSLGQAKRSRVTAMNYLNALEPILSIAAYESIKELFVERDFANSTPLGRDSWLSYPARPPACRFST